MQQVHNQPRHNCKITGIVILRLRLRMIKGEYLHFAQHVLECITGSIYYSLGIQSD